MDALNLKDPQYFINREQSLLQFNTRVLELSKDESIPLLERLRFLCISTTNLDEFFEIRVAGLKQKAVHGITQTGSDSKSPNEILNMIDAQAHELVAEQYPGADSATRVGVAPGRKRAQSATRHDSGRRA